MLSNEDFNSTNPYCHFHQSHQSSANIGQGFSYHQFVDAENEEQFNEFVSTCKKLSFYDTGITPAYGDKLICLSTCEYTLDNGRLVVAAVRIT